MIWYIAQLNVAHALYPMEDPRMSGFMDQLDEVNALADRSPGFVWRLQSDSGNATDIDVAGDPNVLVNMSVWESLDALFEFAYRSIHQRVVADRRQWFERSGQPYQVLWWVRQGHLPDVEEGLARLELLRRDGPMGEAFDFKHPQPQPELQPESKEQV